ncbi:acid phosphatase AphA [Pluralibacter gergoviae]
MANDPRRVVFFDLDGTLHRQDMFGSFMLYALRRHPLNIPLVILLLPVSLIGFLIKGWGARWPVSVLVWGVTVGHSESHLRALEAKFVTWFRSRVMAFPQVHEQLTGYLTSGSADVWLITGSPKHLVELVYYDAPWLGQVNLIGSAVERRYGGWVLALRCFGQEKVKQLSGRIGTPLQLYSGYSDSSQDNPLLHFCEHRWRVTPQGSLQQLE